MKSIIVKQRDEWMNVNTTHTTATWIFLRTDNNKISNVILNA
jgi:hypothetical protein